MSRIIIEKVDELPEYIKNNSEDYWDYPIEELYHILEINRRSRFQPALRYGKILSCD